MARHLVIIDGLSFFFRAYHGVRPLTRSDGLHTNALFGFSQMLIKVVKDLQPDACCVALDTKHTFRNDLYPAYKANRKDPDPEMLEQFPYFEPLIQSFGIPALRVEGFEADDIIATLVAKKTEDEVITIVSSDKDLMQLIRPGVVMLDTMKDKTFGPDEVAEKFGVGPDKVTEVQALIGDSSDNVPGVMGIGPVGASKLINEYGTLERIYENLGEIKGKVQEHLANNRENAFLSRKLVTLATDVPVDEHDFTYRPTPEKARDFLLELEFRTLAGRLNAQAVEAAIAQAKADGAPAPAAAKPVYETIYTKEQLQNWVEKIKAAGRVAVDTETTSLDALQAHLVGISLAVKAGEACYIPLTHQQDMLSGGQPQLEKAFVLETLQPVLADAKIQKIGQNIKYDLLVLGEEKVTVTPVDDTMVMSFCLHGGEHNHGMDTLALMYLGHQCIAYKDVCGTGTKQITFDHVPIDRATAYAAEDADITLRLYDLFKAELDAAQKVKEVYERIERPVIAVLTAMERRGVLVNKNELQSLSEAFEARLRVHEQKVFELAGTQFNLNSPKQLGEVLFDQMGLQGGKKTQTGWSTNEETLSVLAEEGHAIAAEVLSYRSLAKLKSTYTDALQHQVNPRTGRVHTSYNQTGAATGRLSSSDPNLQNIPIRTEDGRKIRHAFIAAPGHTLVSADYSQVELRIMAHMANVGGLKHAFANDVDIHAHTAHQIFDVPVEQVDSDQRRAAKIINFGIVYGMGAFSLAKQLGVPNSTAKAYIDNYFARYDGIRQFMDYNIQFAREHGYVETLYGRRIHTPNINAKNGGLKAGAERAAINAPLQGTNADIMKKVMPVFEADYQTGKTTARLLMQVHDELIFEVPDAALEKESAYIRHVMEGIVKLDVPLKVGLGHGQTWEDAH
ncbi:MAG: DNA polymerase I [Proteobacteria bacterium]|nr:DNA polymerase I [Pseudomonadota bacterium]